jgi:predicted dinucleotide-binding enzyme
MKIGIIGSGIVGQTLGGRLLELGHEVMISSRDTSLPKDTGWAKLPSVDQWVKDHRDRGRKAHGGSFRDAAKFGEVVINATKGVASVEALTAAGRENLRGKVLVELANPLEFSKTGEMTLTVANTDSLAERIQREFPEAKVVKTFNTVTAPLMVNPGALKGDHALFVAGNDAAAKQWVEETLLKQWLGWKSVIDLGDLTAARGMEAYLHMWLKLMGKLGGPMFNIGVVR